MEAVPGGVSFPAGLPGSWGWHLRDGAVKGRPLLLGLPHADPSDGAGLEEGPCALRLALATMPMGGSDVPAGVLAGDGGDLPLHGLSPEEMAPVAERGMAVIAEQSKPLVLLGGGRSVLLSAWRGLESVWGEGRMAGINGEGYYLHQEGRTRWAREHQERPFGEAALELAAYLNGGDWGWVHVDLTGRSERAGGLTDGALRQLASLAGRLESVSVFALAGVQPYGRGGEERMERAVAAVGAFLEGAQSRVLPEQKERGGRKG